MLSRCQGSFHLSRSASTPAFESLFIALARTSYQQRRVARHRREIHSESVQSDKPPQNIFSGAPGRWDRIFEDQSDYSDIPHYATPLRWGQTQSPSRRQTMTNREARLVVDAMLTGGGTRGPAALGGKKNVDDIIRQLYRHSKRMREEPKKALLDQKKEEMSRCLNDRELLEWAVEDVFGEFSKYEGAASVRSKGLLGSSRIASVAPATYPQVISILMSTFRDKYRDPHLALAIFHHTKRLSLASYVFGCSTDVYNQVIQTYWSCFKDAPGLHDVVVEMLANGIAPNGHTRKLVEGMRQDISSQGMDLDGVSDEKQKIWSILLKLEGLLGSARVAPNRWEQWKYQDSTTQVEDNYIFDDWDALEGDFSATKEYRRQGGEGRHRSRRRHNITFR